MLLATLADGSLHPAAWEGTNRRRTVRARATPPVPRMPPQAIAARAAWRVAECPRASIARHCAGSMTTAPASTTEATTAATAPTGAMRQRHTPVLADSEARAPRRQAPAPFLPSGLGALRRQPRP